MPIRWNSNRYDVPKIRRDYEAYNLPFELQRWVWFDLMLGLKRARQRMMPSWSLKYVAQGILKKLYTKGKFSDLTPKQIEERCLRDVQLTLEIDQKLGISDSCIARASFSHMPNGAIYTRQSNFPTRWTTY
jgi:hypothetical protein